METPLDLLSRAAMFIHEQMKATNSPGDEPSRESSTLARIQSHLEARATVNSRDWPAKDLPTKAKKEKRKKDIHDAFSTSSSLRSKYVTHKEAGSAEHRTKEDGEAPLDMSICRRMEATNVHASSMYHNSKQYSAQRGSPVYVRPSVITCSPTPRTSGQRGGPSPHLASPLQSASPSIGADNRSHRREIISSGVCDPVIDEHFRRSLGERYSHLFAASSTSPAPPSAARETSVHSGDSEDKSPTVNISGLSVDDHFAKALGETWVKLQNDSGREKAKGHVTEGSSSQSQQQPQQQQHHGLVVTRVDLVKNV